MTKDSAHDSPGKEEQEGMPDAGVVQESAQVVPSPDAEREAAPHPWNSQATPTTTASDPTFPSCRDHRIALRQWKEQLPRDRLLSHTTKSVPRRAGMVPFRAPRASDLVLGVPRLRASQSASVPQFPLPPLLFDSLLLRHPSLLSTRIASKEPLPQPPPASAPSPPKDHPYYPQQNNSAPRVTSMRSIWRESSQKTNTTTTTNTNNHKEEGEKQPNPPSPPPTIPQLLQQHVQGQLAFFQKWSERMLDSQMLLVHVVRLRDRFLRATGIATQKLDHWWKRKRNGGNEE